MTLLNPLRRWTSSLLAHLELGRKQRLRRDRRSGHWKQVERLEKRALLSSVVVQSPPVVQFDISSVANADVVITKPAGGAVDTDQTSVDRNISGGDWSMLTQSAANFLKPASDKSADALPDNGFFAANAFHPDVQLSFNNQTDGNNVRRADVDGLVAPVSQFAFTLNVPQNNYTDLHVFLTSGHGQSVFNLKLNYSDGSSTNSTATTVPDWFFPVTNSSSQYNLITGMDREKANLTAWQDANQATIFGFHFSVDSTKVLQSFSITPVSVQGSIVFFGATGVVANHAPVLSAIPDQNINEQNTLTVAASATDPDGNAITYSLDAAPSGASINPSTGVITWTPTETQGPGNYGMTVRATDNGSPPLSDVKSFNVAISDIAPTLANPGNQTVDELTPLAFTLSASDPDLAAEQLTYSIATGALPGMSLDSHTGAFSWTPSELQDGVGNVTFRVSDEDGASDSKTIAITVNEVNSAPVLTVTNPPTVVKTTTLTALVASATDSDFVAGIPNTLTYSLLQTGGPSTASGVSLDANSGILAWTPSADQVAGAYTFNVSVDDNTHSANSVVTKPITVALSSVGIVNGDLLVVGTSSADNISITPGSGTLINVAVNSENYTVDGTSITGKIKVLGFQGADTVQVSGAISHTFDVEESGSSDTLIVTATDANDTIALANQTITVDANVIGFTSEHNLIVNALGGDDSVSMTGQAGAFSTTIDGGAGLNSFNASLSGDFNSILKLLDIESADITVAGNFSGNLTAEENVAAPGSGVISSLTIGGSITASGYVDAGAISNVSVAHDMDGTVIADGAGTITDMNIGGTLNGSMTSVEDSNSGSGLISGGTIGSVGSTGSISGGTLTGMTVTGDMAGTITAQGAGSITGMSIGSLTGSMTSVEDSNSGSGLISGGTIGTVGSTGSISGGTLTGMTVTGDMAGTITAQGAGSITGMSIGSLTGSMTSVEDSNSGSGLISGGTIGSVGSTGSISGGTLTGMTVTGDMAGTITAQGAGTITGMSIGTLDGSMTAVEDKNASSGTISGTSLGSVGSTGSMSGGTLTGITVSSDMAGTITAQGAGTITGINVHGKVSGKIEAKTDSDPASGKIGTLIAGGITGKVLGKNIDVLTVTGSVGGQVNVTNTIGNATFGSIAGTGSVTANTLSTVTVNGPISGNLSAAIVGTLQGTNDPSATADHTTVFTVTEAGVERRIVAIPINGATAMPAGVKISYFYDGSSGINPEAAVRVTNGNPTTSADDVPFDLELISNTAKEFDLARLDANGTSDVRNVVVQGNILPTITAGMASFLSLPPTATGGVQLPLDNINGAFAADNVRAGTVLAKSVQAVSFGSVTAAGVTTPAASAAASNALASLAAGTKLAQSNSTYIVPFSENQKVALFDVATSNATGFNPTPVLFTDQIVDNKSITAVVTVTGVPGSNSTIQSVTLQGAGGAIQTGQWIQAAITSTGPLGDLILSATQGITAHVSAPTIIGNIDATLGPITAIVETTAGDFGRALTDATGKITKVTYVHSGSNNLSGRIISRGNLVSSVLADGGMTGVIAAQGDIGAIQRDANGKAVVGTDIANSLTRFGGIRVNGGMSGQIVSLGNIFGDLTFNGGLGGRIAVKGRQVLGLDAQRYGILGAIVINGGIGAGAAIVSAGVVGDDGVYIGVDSDAYGTQLTINGQELGILAAESDINFGKTGKLNTAGLFENAKPPNKAQIDAIFTQGGTALTIDNGLALILADLTALHVGSDGNLTGTVT